MEIEWSSESVLRLVEEYKKHPELWDHDHQNYRVQPAKYEAWSQIAKKFGCDIVDVRKKFNSLMASRRREKARVRDGGKSNWYLYPHLSFLAGHIDQPDLDTGDNFRVEIEEEVSHHEAYSSNAEDEIEDTNTVIIKHEPVATYKYITASALPQTQVIKNKTSDRKRLKRKVTKANKTPEQVDEDIPNSSSNDTNLGIKIAEMIKLLRKTENCKKKDECDTFGEYIASSLRKHDDRTQSMIKQAINNILFEQEMKKYNTESYTVIISDPIENPLGAVTLTDDVLDGTHRK